MPYQGRLPYTYKSPYNTTLDQGTQTVPSLAFLGDTNNGLFSPATDNVAITTNGSEKLRVTNDGNVGIGTTNPPVKLTVVGNVRAGYDANVGVTLGLSPVGIPTNDNNSYILWGDATSFGGANGDLIYIPRTSTDTSHRFYTGTTTPQERVRITSTGNVGMGTTNPLARLHVVSSSAEQVRLTKNGAEGLEVFLGNSTDVNLFQHFNRTSNTWVENRQNALRHTFANSGNGNEVFRIESNGNVGIGTTNLSFGKLDIAGATENQIRINNTNETGHGTVSAKIVAGGSFYQTMNLHASNFIFQTYNGSAIGERIKITSAGDLHSVWNDGRFLGSYYDANYYMGFTFGASNRELYIDSKSSDTRADIVFRTLEGVGTPVERVRIRSNGNVGIGTSNPSVKFEVWDGQTTLSGRAKANTGTTLRLTTTDASNKMELLFDHSASNYWRLQSVEQDVAYRSLILQSDGGNVGIGVTNPTSKLTTITNSNDDGVSIRLQAVPVGDQGPRLIFGHNTNNGVQQIFAAIKSQMRSGNDVNWSSDLGFYVGGSSLTQAFTIANTGNIGIGTTNPAAQFHVGGSASNNNPWGVFDISDGYFKKLHFSEERGAYGLTGYGGYIGYDASANTLTLGVYENSAENRSINIKRDNGNVGIGTTGPSTTLEVRKGGTNTVSGNLFGGGFTQTIVSGESQLCLVSNIDETGNFGSIEVARGGIGFSWANVNDRTRFIVGTHSNHPVRFFTNNTEKVRIQTDGTTSINATVPTPSNLKPDLITQSGVVGPIFYWPLNTYTVAASTSGPGYYDIPAGGSRLNLADPQLGASYGGSIFQGGLINGYGQSFSNTDTSARREEMNWNRIRLIFRGLCPGTDHVAVAVKFRYSTYHYASGWSDHAATEWTFDGTEQARGARWVVGPWINPVDYFAQWADVPAFALYYNDNSSGRTFRISGGVYMQFAHFN